MPQGEGSDAAILAMSLGPLVASSLPFLLFGGWAEELSDLRSPGPHRDIDLLLLAPCFAELENAPVAERWLPGDPRKALRAQADVDPPESG